MVKEVDQGSVSEGGEQAENEELVPKSGAVDSLEKNRTQIKRASFANVVGLKL